MALKKFVYEPAQFKNRNVKSFNNLHKFTFLLEDSWEDLKYSLKKTDSLIEKKEFDKIDYCKNCDFLYDDPEVLIWSNDPSAKINHMLGTEEDFILTEYDSKSKIQ